MSSYRGPDMVSQFHNFNFSSRHIDTSTSGSLDPPNMPTLPPHDSTSTLLDRDLPSDDEPGDDEPRSDRDRNPFDNDESIPLPPNLMMVLADTICGLADITCHNLTSKPSQRTKVWEPDTFDSTNTHKLSAFIVQFTFAQSSLKGMALKWFEPNLLHTEDPDLYAKHQLDNLSMKDSQRINNGLPDCIKDEIARVGKPAMLTELHILSQGINTHYWEHKSKITRQAKPANPPPSNTHTLSSTRPMPNPTSSTSAHNSDSRVKAPPPHSSQPDL
ncbi:hypothetical protein PAXRUDRAFT_18519 [Paxillus rubicundulus Ve08.2h10]|uniref:Uncharacterized protein n=1 Tax=Paxillus rubicundulus Ve08.2h10 TaxID=930991 RepID=A0A0D0CLB5_9AGAM|nr:hypothetical protein PAXRUDRAFT_18519 [Paxillus rubicundulus Ve08.2h10]